MCSKAACTATAWTSCRELHLGHTPISFSEVAGKGKEKITFDCVPIAEATRYSAEDADVTLRLHLLLKPRLAEMGKVTVYETLERPLVPVLADMERGGHHHRSGSAAQAVQRFRPGTGGTRKTRSTSLPARNSISARPSSLATSCSENSRFPAASKTKTGAWSTDVDVLEDVAAQGHEIAKKVLDWRGLAKLRGTYTDALPATSIRRPAACILPMRWPRPRPGAWPRPIPICRTFPSAPKKAAASARPSSRAKGHKLISADYSQIELRLLAHIADIPQLKKAFAEGLDIHAMTASEIFGVPVKDMPAEVRRRAKAINFGIVYGISGFGLANQLGIARSEADDYIKKYFQRFPGIRDYMEATKEFAREHGYVETLFGRRIHIREIKSTVPGMRGGAERAAINAPIQGTAADIIRRAMVRVPGALAAKRLKAKHAAAGA